MPITNVLGICDSIGSLSLPYIIKMIIMMNDQEKIASPETRKELNKVLGFSIQQSTSLLEDLLAQKNGLKGIPITQVVEIHNPVVEFCIFLNYVIIEFSSITRAFLRAEIAAEKKFHLKFINWIILESYKYLYGYGKSVNKSLWKKNVVPLRNIFNNPQFIADFEVIERQIIEFGDSNITNKDYRDITVHYDLDPFRIYEMLTGLNEENESQRALAFLRLLNELIIFTNKCTRLLCGVNVVNRRFPEKIQYAPARNSINYFGTDLISTIDKYIIQDKNSIDGSILQQKWIEQHAIQEKNNTSFKPLQLASLILKVQTFIYLLRIDLFSATKAYFVAEYPIEKQLFLKRINTIIFEGFKKLYGLNSNDNTYNTYWNIYITEVANNIKSNSYKRLSDELDQKLQMLRPKIKGLEEQRQLSVHLEDGIETIYEMLVNLKPEVEFQKQKDFFQTIMQILFQTIVLLKPIENQSAENSKNARLKTIQSAEKVLELLENSPNCPGKDETMKIVKQIISGEFYENIMKKSGVRNF